MFSTLLLQPSKVASECLCLGLRRAARALSRRYDEALQPLDLNNGQFSMLTMIAGLQPVGMQALADRLAMDRTTVTAALKPLQRRGLVTVEASEHDLRGRDARLAPPGGRCSRRRCHCGKASRTPSWGNSRPPPRPGCVSSSCGSAEANDRSLT